MDFLKTLLAYMAATLVVAVESTSTPSVTPVPTPAPTPEGPAAVETMTSIPSAEETPSPTATVSVTPEPVPAITANTKAYHNLGMGDKGEEVRRLQERLIELKYLPEGSADGAYGGQTRMAVRRFQYYNGLTVDGIAGRMTQTYLFENPDVVPYPNAETPTPESTETPAPEGTGETPETASPAPESPEEPTVTPYVAATPTQTVTAQPTEEATEEITAEPAETESAAPTETPTAPPEETEAPPEETKTPEQNPETATPEPSADPEGSGNTPEAPTEATVTPNATELTENIDLDAQEETPTPAPTEEPVKIEYEDLAGWIVLNDSGESMQWTELEDGVPVVRSPRMQRNGEDIRVSLDDLCKSVESWHLTDEGDSVVLEAAGFTLALLNEEAGFVSTVDGLEMVTEYGDFDFSEGHFIRVHFLTRALDGSWEWDEEEETLMIRIPEKDSAAYTD